MHVTTHVPAELPSLRRRDCLEALLDCLHEARRRDGFRLCHFSIQANHLHTIVEARDAGRLASGMRGVHGRLAKCVNRELARSGRVFDKRFHAHVLRTPTEVRHALQYVLCNARKHGITLPYDRPDPFSSGPWFEHWAEPYERPPELGPSPVAQPETWLLSTGWLRHGPISLAARPMSR